MTTEKSEEELKELREIVEELALGEALYRELALADARENGNRAQRRAASKKSRILRRKRRG